MFRDEEWWVNTYERHDCYWLHDGNMNRPHAELTSGLHSTGFCDSRPIIADDGLLICATSDLITLLDRRGLVQQINHVTGPQTGATKLAEFMARPLRCTWSSPRKSAEGEPKAVIFDDEQIPLVLAATGILGCEDVVTTGGTLELAAAALRGLGKDLLPFVVAMMNRSGLCEVNGREIFALINRHMPTWLPADCPLCKQGSKAIRPKKDNNWALLTAHYD